MTTQYLTDSEILTVALNMEDEGCEFYNNAALGAKNRETKEVFERLRSDESEHRKIFKDMLDSLPDNSSKDYFGIRDEIADYLKALVDTGVFKSVDKSFFKNLNEIKALEKSVQAERDAVLFYSEAERFSVNPKAKEIMSKIIDIEKEHIVTLASRLRVAHKLF